MYSEAAEEGATSRVRGWCGASAGVKVRKGDAGKGKSRD